MSETVTNERYLCIRPFACKWKQFAALVAMMIEAATSNFGGVVSDDLPLGSADEVFRRGAIETVGHQLACMFTQRYDVPCTSADLVEALDLWNDYPAGRDDLIEGFILRFEPCTD